MLRQIKLVSLAAIACAVFIPTKVNAATLTFLPTGLIEKNPGDSITFKVLLKPEGKIIFNSIAFEWDGNELSYSASDEVKKDTVIENTTTIATITFDVFSPVKGGKRDLFVTAAYRLAADNSVVSTIDSTSSVDVVPTPEPLTIFGSVTALGYAVFFKRKFSQKKKS
jgi:hypothetical protein